MNKWRDMNVIIKTAYALGVLTFAFLLASVWASEMTEMGKYFWTACTTGMTALLCVGIEDIYK